MEYKERKDNIEYVYDVEIDRDKLNGLLNRLVRDLSYREEGVFKAPYEASIDPVTGELHGAFLPNGDPMFECVRKACKYTSEEGYVNDSIAVDGIKVCAPKLATLIKGVLNGDETSLYELAYYKNDQELIPIEDRIKKANERLDSQIDTSTKEERYEALRDVCDDYENGRFYDTKLLSNYYDQACSLIELTQVRQITTYKFPQKRKLR